MSYLDTWEYYQQRHREIDFALLRRSYMEGTPYNVAEDSQFDYSQLWAKLLSPTDEEGDFPSYLENLPKILLQGMVDDILPPDSKLVVDGLDEKSKDEMLELMLNFGTGYAQGADALLLWFGEVLLDIATVGDGLLHLRLLESGVRWHYYPMEEWDAEAEPDSDEPMFYRIEYKFKKALPADSQNAARTVVYWRRIDIHKNQIVRYSDTPDPVGMDNGQVPPDIKPLAGPGSMLVPPDMRANAGADILKQLQEALLLERMGEFICSPIVWRRKGPGQLRGVSELSIDRLIATDDNNRLLTNHKNSAIDTGDPILGAIDLDIPEEEGEDDQMSRAATKGDIIAMNSNMPDRAGRLTFPENQPQKLLHAEARTEVRRSMLQASQNLGIDIKDLLSRGDISGFAMQQMNEYHNKLVQRTRTRIFDNGLFIMLKRAQKMLEITQRITAEQAKAKIRIEYGSRNFSPDENLKQTTMFSMLMDRNIPPEELVQLLPFRPNDRKAVIEAMEEKVEEAKENQQMLQTLRNGSINDQAGVDKRQRTSNRPGVRPGSGQSDGKPAGSGKQLPAGPR